MTLCPPINAQFSIRIEPEDIEIRTILEFNPFIYFAKKISDFFNNTRSETLLIFHISVRNPCQLSVADSTRA